MSKLEELMEELNEQDISEAFLGLSVNRIDTWLHNSMVAIRHILKDITKIEKNYSQNILVAFKAINSAQLLLEYAKSVIYWDTRGEDKNAEEEARKIKLMGL